jgi:molybdenum cofactor biosynthesis enzyme MoaA
VPRVFSDCLYVLNERGRLYRAEIHHAPWPLQAAKGRIEVNTITPPGLELREQEPLLHFAKAQDIVIRLLKRVPTRKGNVKGGFGEPLSGQAVRSRLSA